MCMSGCVCMCDSCVNVRACVGVSRLNNELTCKEYTLKMGTQQSCSACFRFAMFLNIFPTAYLSTKVTLIGLDLLLWYLPILCVILISNGLIFLIFEM